MLKKKLSKFANYKKAVIVGGGPSTGMQDWNEISKISNDTIFLACNRISLIFNNTQWRPDIYTCFASSSLKDKAWIESVDACLSDENILSFVFKDFAGVSSLKTYNDNVVLCKNVLEHYRHDPVPAGFLDCDLDKGLLKSYSATVPLFQICDHLNIKKLMVIGQDGYTFDKGHNHFHKNYQDEPSNFKKVNDRILRLHSELKDYFNKKNIQLYNGSKSTILKDTYDFIEINKFITEM